MGFEVILSLSYELLDQHCPEAWKQRAENGDPALTGWEPPSALLSPANEEAMAWLQDVARAFAALAVGGGAAGAVPGRRALVVGDAGRADLPLRRRGGGGVRSGADRRRAGRRSTRRSGRRSTMPARCWPPRPRPCATRCGTRRRRRECLLLVYLPTVLGAAGGEAGQCAARLGGAGLRCAAARGL